MPSSSTLRRTSEMISPFPWLRNEALDSPWNRLRMLGLLPTWCLMLSRNSAGQDYGSSKWCVRNQISKSTQVISKSGIYFLKEIQNRLGMPFWHLNVFLFLSERRQTIWIYVTFLYSWGVSGTAASRAALGAEKASTFELNDRQFSALLSPPWLVFWSDWDGSCIPTSTRGPQIMNTGTDKSHREGQKAEHNTNAQRFLHHPSLWLWLLLKKPQPTAHRLEQQQHQMEYGWTEWSKPSACNNVTNQRIFSEEARKRQASWPR